VDPIYEYKFARIWCQPPNDNLNDINKMLADGWEAVRESPMGGGIVSSCSLVLLRKIVCKPQS
jgi:hypothetical protein